MFDKESADQPAQLSQHYMRHKLAHNIIVNRGPDHYLLETTGGMPIGSLQELPDSGPCVAILVWKEKFTEREELRVRLERKRDNELQPVDGSMLAAKVPVEQISFHLGGQPLYVQPAVKYLADPFSSILDLNNLPSVILRDLGRLIG